MTEHKPPQTPEHLSRPTLVLAFISAFVFLYLRTFLFPATPFSGLGDQLLFFSRAARLLYGQVLYRDVFELVPPGTELLDVAYLRLFGMHAWLIQAAIIVFGLAFACLITRIASRILHGPLILLPALLFLVFDFNSAMDLTHHWYSTFFAMAAVATLMDAITIQRIAAAGSLCAIATLFTQTQGGLAFLALIVYLVWRKQSHPDHTTLRIQLTALILPFALILTGVLGYYAYKASFRTVFFDLAFFAPRFLIYNRRYLGEIPPVHSPADFIRVIPFLFIYAINPYIYLVGLYRLWRTRNDLPISLQQNLVLLNLVGLALFIAIAISGPTFFRIATTAPPAILIFTWLLSRQTPVYRCIRTALCAVAILFALPGIFYRQTHWHAILNLPTGATAFIDPLSYNEFHWLAQRTHPGDLVFNNFALGLYLSLKNPTNLEFIANNDFTRPEQVSAAIQSLQQHPPRYIVLIPPNPSAASQQDTHDHGEPFRQFVHNHYHLAETFPLHGGTQYEEQLWELDAPPDSQSK